MDQRQILVVENDAAYADQIRGSLEPLGLQVQVVGDGGEGLQQAKSNPPELILLSVELPNMSGYSICNKLKKNPDLKRIPLIIMSAEATPEIFEQHKKLKTRAEDYLIKPFAMEDLLEKMGQLIELSAPERVEVDDEDVIEISGDEFEVTEDPYEEPTKLVDQEISMATDAAFAALEMEGMEEGGDEPAAPQTPRAPQAAQPQQTPHEEPTRRADAMELLLPSEAAVEEGMQTEGEPVTAPPVDALEMERTDVPDEMMLETEALAQKLMDEAPTMEGQPDAVALPEHTGDPTAVEQSPDLPEPEPLPLREPASASAPDTSRYERRIADLERENRRLEEELQSAMERGPAEGAPPPSRDRELLNLREVINKKEKEILDLRDDIHSKERQILDHKDKVRELERKVRDMDEKLLGVEREMLSANERMEALQKDKQKLQERESGIKARLSEAKEEIEKAYAEIDEIKQRSQDEIERLKSEYSAQLTAEQDRHSGELERLGREGEEAQQQLRDEHAAALERAAAEQQDALARAAADKQQALEEAKQEHEAAAAELRGQHDGELQALRTSHQENINSLQSEHEEALEAERQRAAAAAEELRQQHARQVQSLRDEHAQAVEELRGEHSDEIEGLNERHRQQMEQKDAEHAGEKEALRTEHRAEMTRQQQQHDEDREQLERDHRDRLSGMENRHAAQVEDLEGKTAAAEQRIAELEDEIGTTQQKLSETKDQLRGREKELTEAHDHIHEQEDVIAEHEKQATAYQDQLMKAFNKIRNDEALAEKAQRAMAVAITLLEEQKKVSATEEEGDQERAQDRPQ